MDPRRGRQRKAKDPQNLILNLYLSTSPEHVCYGKSFKIVFLCYPMGSGHEKDSAARFKIRVVVSREAITIRYMYISYDFIEKASFFPFSALLFVINLKDIKNNR